MSTITLERIFCKFCRAECFEEEDKRYQAHKDCINTFPICDKCGNGYYSDHKIQRIIGLVNYKYKYLCMDCVKAELERRTTTMINQIKDQYSLRKEFNAEGKDYNIKVNITIEEKA